jgi:DNA-binding beta-propeller fold protein YncE
MRSGGPRLFSPWLIALLAAVALGAVGVRPASPDPFLLVSSNETDSVLRFDAMTGVHRHLRAIGSGGLNGPIGLVFGADGNLYVSSVASASVLRYDGVTGEFIDAFVPSGSDGLNPQGLVFGPDGNLYVSSIFGRVLR